MPKGIQNEQALKTTGLQVGLPGREKYWEEDWRKRLKNKDYEWLLADFKSLTSDMDRIKQLKNLLTLSYQRGKEEGKKELWEMYHKNKKLSDLAKLIFETSTCPRCGVKNAYNWIKKDLCCRICAYPSGEIKELYNL